MASIGPSLPPHLAKRKRTPEDEPSTDSPPAKIRAAESSAQANKDEIELESDDDGYGPSAPGPTTRPSIGPSLPPSTAPTPPPAASKNTSLRHKSKNSATLEGDDGRNIGHFAPQRPPTTTRPSAGPAAPPTNTNEISLDSGDEDEPGPAPPEPKRIHGPAPPPAALSERPPRPADSDASESDDDDDYGPALPSSTSHQQRQARALAAAAAAEAAASGAPKRDDWMLAPPSAGGYRDADPTKLKARRFNSGPRASGSGDGEISSIWTETPEEKRKRLENAVLGRDTGSGPNPNSSSNRSSHTHSKSRTKREEEAAEQAARIQGFTEATRGRSLYDEHQAARQGSTATAATAASNTKKSSWVDEEEDDPSKRAFDREKDMKLGGRIGAAQRRELLSKAADFGGRFAKGKYL